MHLLADQTVRFMGMIEFVERGSQDSSSYWHQCRLLSRQLFFCLQVRRSVVCEHLLVSACQRAAYQTRAASNAVLSPAHRHFLCCSAMMKMTVHTCWLASSCPCSCAQRGPVPAVASPWGHGEKNLERSLSSLSQLKIAALDSRERGWANGNATVVVNLQNLLHGKLNWCRGLRKRKTCIEEILQFGVEECCYNTNRRILVYGDERGQFSCPPILSQFISILQFLQLCSSHFGGRKKHANSGSVVRNILYVFIIDLWCAEYS